MGSLNQRRWLALQTSLCFGRVDAVLGGECLEHPDLEFGEQHVGRQVGLVATEQRHEEDAPGDDEVDGGGAGQALGAAVGEFLDLAAGLEDAMPVLDAPAAGVVFDDAPAGLGRVGGEGGEQQPADWRGAFGGALLLDQHALQADRRLAAVFATGGREFDGVGVQRHSGTAAGATGARLAPTALRARGQPVDGDHGTGAHGRGAQGVEQRPPAGDAAAALDAHQQVGLRSRAPVWLAPITPVGVSTSIRVALAAAETRGPVSGRRSPVASRS